MHKKFKATDTVLETDVFLSRDKYYPAGMKTSADRNSKEILTKGGFVKANLNKIRDYDEIIHYRALGQSVVHQSTNIKPKIIVDKIITDFILICKDDRGYIIEDYSRGMKRLFINNDLIGRDILTELPQILLPKILEEAMKISLSNDVSSSYKTYVTIDEINYNIFLKVIPISLHSSTKILISFRYINNSKYSHSSSKLPAQGDFYFNNEGVILSINTEKGHDNRGALPYYDQLLEKSRTKTDMQTAKKINHPSRSCINEKALKVLTNREQEIILMVLEGNTNKYISVKLSISEGTVKRTLYNAYRKLNISSRMELAKLLLVKRTHGR